MISQELVTNNLAFYDTIKPKNPRGSYTVLATVNDHETGRLLALASGTQATLRLYEDDIEDCHAESLLKRAYKRYLVDRVLEHASKHKDLRGSRLKDELKIKCQQELTIFISQFPCGLIRRYEGEEPTDKVTGSVIKRKPGRGQDRDGQTMYVERDNCFEKLRRWSADGFQGRRIAQALSVQSKIVKIIIGDCEPELNIDYKLHLERLGARLSEGRQEGGILCDLVAMRRDGLVFDKSTKQPQPVALIWWANSTEVGGRELIVDGRKMGLTRKQCLSGRPKYRLRIGDRCLGAALDNIERLIGA